MIPNAFSLACNTICEFCCVLVALFRFVRHPRILEAAATRKEASWHQLASRKLRSFHLVEADWKSRVGISNDPTPQGPFDRADEGPQFFNNPIVQQTALNFAKVSGKKTGKIFCLEMHVKMNVVMHLVMVEEVDEVMGKKLATVTITQTSKKSRILSLLNDPQCTHLTPNILVRQLGESQKGRFFGC